MTQLRDARLQRALDAAPDAALAPADAVRARVRDFAHRAVVQPATPAWKKWWNFTGSQSPAWNAAFATVAVAALVTVLWYDREMPDEGTSRVADRAAPAAVPAPATAPAPAPAPAAPPTTIAVASGTALKQPPVERRKAPAPVRAPEKAAQPVDVATGTGASVATGIAAGGPSADLRADSRSEALHDQQPGALAKAAPATAASPAAQRQAATEFAIAPAAPAPAAPQAAGARALSRDAVAAAKVQSPAEADRWTRARIEVRGSPVEVERTQADRLPALLAAVARSPAAARPLREAAAATIELRGEDGAIDIVQAGSAQVRWTRVRDGRREVFELAPDSALLQSLQQEAERLFGR